MSVAERRPSTSDTSGTYRFGYFNEHDLVLVDGHLTTAHQLAGLATLGTLSGLARLAGAMRARMAELLAGRRKAGYSVDLAVTIDLGYATLGTIGFEGKTEYGAIGTV